jgi:hypothetical protein
MLIFCDLAEQELANIPVALLQVGLSEIVRAHRRGHHLVVIARWSMAWLTRNVDLSPADAAMLRRIGQNFAQAGDLRRKAKVFIRLIESRPAIFQRMGQR